MKFLSNSSKGLKIKKKMKHWTSMCETWAFHIERYARLTECGDTPYNNNERANVGLLASSAWASGAIALEEFQSVKGNDGEEVNGRIDLWLSFESGTEDYVEAKFKKMSIDGNYLNQIEQSLASTVKDALHTKGSDDVSAVAVTFIVFYMKSRSPDEVLNSIDEAILNVNKNIKADVMAWCFPERDVEHVYSDDYIVPGVLMLGKKV
ncbi:hypothetical protein [Vibrio tasmaniensis]|uniref:hypothetical protein n=1 Tax=Vibrio tasmaniensis TaxID=212663 RepID=UPI00107EFAA9|nr:hypothetical protein [Vibrio tasmaniensis]